MLKVKALKGGVVLVLDSKRGQSLGLFEIILVVAVLFIVGVVWLVTSSFSTEINNFLLDDPDFFTTNESRAVVEDLETRKTSFFDGGFGFFVLGMFLLGGVSSWFASKNPVMLVVVLLMLVMVLVIPYFLGDAWLELVDEFGTEGMTFTNFVLSNHLLVSVVFGFMCLLIMFYRGFVVN